MNLNEGTIYYHISREDWPDGAHLEFGSTYNKFFRKLWEEPQAVRYSGVRALTPFLARAPVAMIVSDVVRGRMAREDEPQFAALYDDPVPTLCEGADVIQDSLQKVRELVFEEVRIREYPDRPSRQRCIFLIPNDLQAVEYWWTNALKSLEGKKLYRVRASGNVHVANQHPCRPREWPLREWYQAARAYWRGDSGEPESAVEAILEGTIEILREVDYGELVSGGNGQV